MLFNSYIFIFAFLPVTFAVFFVLGRVSERAAAGWLAIASFFFYGWWDLRYLLLLGASILVNFYLGMLLARRHADVTKRWDRRLLVISICANLALLGYYKYANFFIDNVNAILGAHLSIAEVVLPLGISFFTFTQIAFLVDAWRGEAREYNVIHYALFVTYFPHLIAGPILHHKEMMPQFGMAATYHVNYQSIAVGLTVFAIGLFKKVIIADGVAPFATPIFEAAARGSTLTFMEAWTGALAYTMQLYFDFSGYSDMAIGLSCLLGIRLPLNFNSPYKATNIIEFWRRWHMTLSRFLRDYLYIPLGGNKLGSARRYGNLITTMLLGGLWHGAGWTFVVWGALHGAYLGVNHAWHGLRRRFGHDPSRSTRTGRAVSVAITFLAVVVAWVFFRAANFESAVRVLRGMAGLNGVTLPEGWVTSMPGGVVSALTQFGVEFGAPGLFKGIVAIMWIVGPLLIVWGLPNTQEFMHRFRPALDAADHRPSGTSSRLKWHPTLRWAALSALLFTWSVMSITKNSEFLYFQF